MKEDKEFEVSSSSPEVIGRREFLKKIASGVALTSLTALGLSLASCSLCSDCTAECQSDCTGSCSSTCKGTCNTGCSSTCAGECSGSCYYTCLINAY
jgi:CXXX repeat radical SAM target protein